MIEGTIADVMGRFFPVEHPEWLIDVGVGGGTEAFEMRQLWPDLKVIGLEPCRELREAGEAAGYPGIILPHGAWSHARDHVLRVPTENVDLGPKSSSLFEINGLRTEVRQMVVRPLDELLNRHLSDARSVILWADVEGSELQVLRGAWRMLQRGVVKLCNLEVRPIPLGDGASSEAEVDAFLAAFGFAKVYRWNVHCGADPHADAVYVPISQERTW